MQHLTVKKSPKIAALGFFVVFYTENWAKNRENCLFSQKHIYLKITPKVSIPRRKVLETWNLAKLYTKIVQKEISGYFFDFWLFCQNLGRCRPKITKNWEFWPAAPQITAKSQKSKSGLKFLLVSTIFVYNLAKFQVSSTFQSWLLFFCIILRYRDFNENKGFSLILPHFLSYNAR